MAALKSKEIKEMSENERQKKLKELKMELVRARANTQKTGSSRIKEIKRTIAKILTLSK